MVKVNVPVSLTCIKVDFPDVQIFTAGQELELMEKVEQGAISLIELANNYRSNSLQKGSQGVASQ
jgi:hypothetical protein